MTVFAADVPQDLTAIIICFILAGVILVITLCITYDDLEKYRVKHRDHR